MLNLFVFPCQHILSSQSQHRCNHRRRKTSNGKGEKWVAVQVHWCPGGEGTDSRLRCTRASRMSRMILHQRSSGGSDRQSQRHCWQDLYWGVERHVKDEVMGKISIRFSWLLSIIGKIHLLNPTHNNYQSTAKRVSEDSEWVRDWWLSNNWTNLKQHARSP